MYWIKKEKKRYKEEYEARAIFQSLIALSWISRGALHFHGGQLISSAAVPWASPHSVRPMSRVPIKMLINVCLLLPLPSAFSNISLNCAIKEKEVSGAERPWFAEYHVTPSWRVSWFSLSRSVGTKPFNIRWINVKTLKLDKIKDASTLKQWPAGTCSVWGCE